MSEQPSSDVSEVVSARGTQVFMALIERGVKPPIASDAAAAYVNTLGLLCIGARKFGATLGDPTPKVVVEPMLSGDLQTIVRGGKWEYGKIWLDVDSDPLVFVYASQDAKGNFTVT